MDWVLIILAVSGPGDEQYLSVATAQFETKELCQFAADHLHEKIKRGVEKPIVGMCFPATNSASN